ncbi:MAG: hypothetical protein Q8M56_04130 [Desulfobacterales bacterium]|nr:hypothetical protein [Desulfobacterales bacterium]
MTDQLHQVAPEERSETRIRFAESEMPAKACSILSKKNLGEPKQRVSP